ncbi:MAG: hypothetical protein V3S71_04885 [Acidobacteriota bacterium]
MTRLDQEADLIRMTRYYLDRSYYKELHREEYYAAFQLACEFLDIPPHSGIALGVWEKIEERHLTDPEDRHGSAAAEGTPEDPEPRS